jgi:hypothetical protein
MHTFNTLEIYWLAANILFALLSVWFLFPQCKIPLWGRLLWVAFVLGINAAGNYYDNNVRWLFYHASFYRPFCLWVANAAVFPWLARSSWDEWSDRFEQSHQRLLWGIIVAMFLFIPIVAYLMWRYM